MAKPKLSMLLSKAEFLSHYWLKSELQAFCRTSQLQISGSKIELTQRIAHYLETGQHLKSTKANHSNQVMPTQFHLDTVIEEGWRCTQELRAFFQSQLQIRFHFNGFLRTFIRETGIGKTLREAIEGWKESKRQKAQSPARQFEYNRHIQLFFREYPGSTLQEAIQAWHQKKKDQQTLDLTHP
mgnify:CR=1 FL=1